MKFEHVLVVGAGLMGGGIAQVVAASGRRVSLHDAQPGATDRALDAMRKSLGRLEEKGGPPAQDVLARIATVDDLVPAGLMIEAAVEDAEVKEEIFRRADAELPPDSVLASNTSSIPIGSLAAATRRPDKVIGMHFFNPVPVLKLVEIVRGRDTSDETAAVIAAAVSSEVSRPRTISTSFKTGTGLKKCIPITLSGRRVAAASEPIGMEDVFEASTESGGNSASARRKISSFTSASSTAASIIRPAGTRSSTVAMRASTSCAGGPPFSSSLPRLLRIASSARSVAPGCASCSETRRPDAATTWAIPPPISPAPTTRTCSNFMSASLRG